jgi:hypothetical protein
MFYLLFLQDLRKVLHVEVWYRTDSSARRHAFEQPRHLPAILNITTARDGAPTSIAEGLGRRTCQNQARIVS